MSNRLAGKVAIVTGASSGIGQAIAIALAQEGCAVALAARRAPELEKVQVTEPLSQNDDSLQHIYLKLFSELDLRKWREIDLRCALLCR